MITTHTCGSLSKTKIWKDAIGIECNTKKKFCVLQKKVLSFGPNRTVEVRPNSSAEPNVRSVTSAHQAVITSKAERIVQSSTEIILNIKEHKISLDKICWNAALCSSRFYLLMFSFRLAIIVLCVAIKGESHYFSNGQWKHLTMIVPLLSRFFQLYV